MDALKSLIAHVPDWVKRLDDLSSQIDQRQLELARCVEPGPPVAASPSPAATPSRTKSVRNKGSTESLKPHDEGAVWNEDKAPAAGEAAKEAPATEEGRQAAAAASPPSPGAGERAQQALLKQTTQVAEVAQARVRATLRKRNKRSDSVVSAEGVPKYRTRSMIIVYYDSYVQSFFEELVKFVSAQRNLMRKAKMAAKVAHIKRMAELEMPNLYTDDKNDDAMAVDPVSAGPSGTADKLAVEADQPIAAGPKLKADDAMPATPAANGDGAILAALDSPFDAAGLPKLNYRRTLNMRSPGMLASGRPMYVRASARERYTAGGAASGALGMSMAGSSQAPDVYDELDRGLEYVQSMCEHAAHQFLRDGDCNDEIGNIKRRLSETKEQADREMERVKKEEPEALEALDEPLKSRSFRPHSMRRDGSGIAASAKAALVSAGAAPSAGGATEADAKLEVDEGIDDI